MSRQSTGQIRLVSINSTSGNSTNDFTQQYSPPLYLDPQGVYSVALHSAAMYYAWFNITSEIGNNKFRVWYEGWRDFTIPDGIYAMDGLNREIYEGMKGFGPDFVYIDDSGTEMSRVYFTANYNTMKLEMNIKQKYPGKPEIDEQTLRVDFFNDAYNKIADLLGFDKGKFYYQEFNEAHHTTNFDRDITKININCSLVLFSYENGRGNSQLLYSFTPSVMPGTIINLEPNNLLFVPIRSEDISSIRMYLTDNLGRPVILGKKGDEEPVSYLLAIRRDA